MATISIDGIDYEVKEGENLLHAVLSQGLDLPYFCWHPSMGSVGACRQCAVIEYAGPEDERGRLQMACMTNVSDGMRISVDAEFASNFRSSVIEWLMENHPHDCPVCEEGGECHLQDMTVMTGHSVRRFRGKKRTWQNQDLGPFIGHEMNRCITCYRCVRFYDEYAGGKDLAAFGSRGRMYFGRFEDGTLESEFSGNLVEVCPTGVFTDKPFASSYTRKWDLQTAPSICPGCSVGCNTFPAERYGQLKRITNRYHGELNQYFICDRGRFGSHFVNNENRLRHAGAQTETGVFSYGETAKVIEQAADAMGETPVGIGSPRASFEANFALRELVGSENFCAGVSDVDWEVLRTSLDLMREGGFRIPTLQEVENSDVILILGEDVSNTAPRIALSVRQAVRLLSFDLAEGAEIPIWQDAGVRGHAQHVRNPLFVATPASTRLDEIATDTLSGDAQDFVDAANFIAELLEEETDGVDGDSRTFEQTVAESLRDAKSPLVIVGCSLKSSSLVKAGARIARILQRRGSDSKLAMVPLEPNSFGVALLGGELTLSRALDRIANGNGAVILENDLYRRADRESVDRALSQGNCLVLDSLETPTIEKAKFAFPAATYAEQTGSFVNFEMRAQRFYQVFEPKDEIQPSWKWLTALASATGREQAAWTSLDELLAACADAAFSGFRNVAPNSDFRLEAGTRIPRQTHRYSGRTAMLAHVNIHEPKATPDDETPFSYSMEGQNPGDQDGATIPYSWSPGWNSNQSVFKFQQEVGGELMGGDPGVRLVDAPVSFAGNNHTIQSAMQAEVESGFKVVPIHMVFGSDELSSLSWPIRQRMPAPFLLMSSEDAQRLNLEEGMGATLNGSEESLEVRIDSRLRSGLLGLPVGFVTDSMNLDVVAELRRDPDFVKKPGIDPNLIARG